MLLASVLLGLGFYIRVSNLIAGVFGFVFSQVLSLSGFFVAVYFLRSFSKYSEKSFKKYYSMGLIVAAAYIGFLIVFGFILLSHSR